jgi:hypothetical protein
MRKLVICLVPPFYFACKLRTADWTNRTFRPARILFLQFVHIPGWHQFFSCSAAGQLHPGMIPDVMPPVVPVLFGRGLSSVSLQNGELGGKVTQPVQSITTSTQAMQETSCSNWPL